jgi:biopolymer transport protein ExbD/biopolymer transport protein TolR
MAGVQIFRMPPNLLKRDDALSIASYLGTPAYAEGGSQRWSPFDRPRKRKVRRADYYCSIDSTALAGVFVVLLVMLMVAQPSAHHGLSVDLAKSEYWAFAPGARREDAMTLAVTRDGRLYFRSRQISSPQLPGEILEGIRSGAENRVYLLVDARAKYSDVVTALQGVQRAKVRRVTFLTEALRH